MQLKRLFDNEGTPSNLILQVDAWNKLINKIDLP